MPIALTSDQADLADGGGRVHRPARRPSRATRAAFDKIASGEPQPSWQALVDQRLHAIHLPEWAGGDGAGLVELAVVLEQAAFGLLPGPLLPTVVASQLISCARAAGARPSAAARAGRRRDGRQRPDARPGCGPRAPRAAGG